MISFSKVSKTYPGHNEALRDIDLEIARGELIMITGHSGAGKSTLLKLIAMIERPTRGHIVIDGQNIDRLSMRRVPYYRRRVGYVFQDHRLLLDRTVYDNVALPLVIAGLRRQEIARRVRAALDKVGLLKKERSYPMTLSSGEQQRVGIARAVVHKPPILLADEPTGNLDPELSLEIAALFRQFSQVGVTALIATHDLEVANALATRTIRLQKGVLLDTGGGP